jgi:hypothetical protein
LCSARGHPDGNPNVDARPDRDADDGCYGLGALAHGHADAYRDECGNGDADLDPQSYGHAHANVDDGPFPNGNAVSKCHFDCHGCAHGGCDVVFGECGEHPSR